MVYWFCSTLLLLGSMVSKSKSDFTASVHKCVIYYIWLWIKYHILLCFVLTWLCLFSYKSYQMNDIRFISLKVLQGTGQLTTDTSFFTIIFMFLSTLRHFGWTVSFPYISGCNTITDITRTFVESSQWNITKLKSNVIMIQQVRHNGTTIASRFNDNLMISEWWWFGIV